MENPILSIQEATKIYGGGFLSTSEPLVAIDKFSLDIDDKDPKIVTIAGESGSGKTTLSNLVLNFTECTEGEIRYRGVNLQELDRKQKVAYRKEVQAIFQDPYEVYNPFYRVSHIMNMVIRHFKMTKNRKISHPLRKNYAYCGKRWIRTGCIFNFQYPIFNNPFIFSILEKYPAMRPYS